MNDVDNAIIYFQGFLSALAMIGNTLRTEDEQPYYELSIDKINFDTTQCFEENMKNYFVEISKHHQEYLSRQATDFNKRHFQDWAFEMSAISTNDKAIEKFLSFMNLSDIQLQNLSDEFYQNFEKYFGKIQDVLIGYISPPYHYLIYSQHWQHLYIKTNQAHLLLTFEANT